METSTYVALSGQLALDKRMAALAQNIANARTAGYRAQIVDFKSVLSQAGSTPTAFASASKDYVSEASGGLMQTKNPLDIAVKGNGYLAFQSSAGTYYSRDGRLSLSTDGNLLNAAGDPLLDSGGGAIQVDPRNSDLSIGANGAILQGGQKLSQVGLFDINLNGDFQRTGPSGFIPKSEAVPLTNFNENGVLQGYYEESNVNPATSMTTLIEITRAFEAASNLSEKAGDAQKSAIDILGSRN
jgi:flagellar basal-body rod protein FlgF